VLEACCRHARVRSPALPYVCTVQLARRTWGIYPTKLPDVCASLGIALDHHEALSDAEACARIVLAAGRQNVRAALRRALRLQGPLPAWSPR
jgi:DNA polymerase-3 subunit epsilon